MSIASRIEAIKQHLEDDYSMLEIAGADLTNVDKNIINLKPTWKERLLYFMNNGTDEVWENWEKVVGEGTSLSLNNTLEAKMKIDLKGNTYQYSTTGKNMLNNSSLYLFSSNTYLATTNYSTEGAIQVQPSTTYSLTFKGANSVLADKKIFSYDENQQNKETLTQTITTQDEHTVVSFTTLANTKYISFYVGSGNAYSTVNEYVEHFELMIIQGNTLVPYEQYTGNQPSPNPDYPQDIQVVSGDNTIKVEGKNLFDKDNVNTVDGFFNASNSTLREGNDVKTIYIPCKTNTTYTISKSLGARFYFGYTKTTPTLGTTIYERFGANDDNSPLTITTGSEAQYLVAFIYSATIDTQLTLQDVLDTIQIEKSSTATAYQPYQSQSYPIYLGVENYLQDEYIQAPEGNTINAILKKGTYTIFTEDGETFGNNIYFKLFDNNGTAITTSGHLTTANFTISFSSSSYYYYGGSSREKIIFTLDNDYKLNIGMTNATGTRKVFVIKGNTPQYVSTTPIELCKIGEYQDHIQKYKVDSKLPSGYTQVEYIQSSGTQYIDTGYKATNKTQIEAKLHTTETGNKNWFGGGANLPNYFVFNSFSSNQIEYRYDNMSNWSTLTIQNNVVNRDFLVKFGNGILDIDNVNYAQLSTDTFQDTLNLCLFVRNGGSAYISGRIYYFKIYENNTLVRDMIPCIRNSDSAVGLYDRVSKTFFANAGTGTFSYGRENGKWYLNKQIGKVVLDGSEDWNKSGTSGTEHRNACQDYQSVIKGTASASTNPDIFCNRYTKKTSNQTYTKNQGMSISTAGTIEIYDNVYNTSNVNLFKTWLSNNNVELYYVLKTPTYEEITDTTLINQLNALENANSYNEQTNVNQVNNDLASILNVTALQEIS